MKIEEILCTILWDLLATGFNLGRLCNHDLEVGPGTISRPEALEWMREKISNESTLNPESYLLKVRKAVYNELARELIRDATVVGIKIGSKFQESDFGKEKESELLFGANIKILIASHWFGSLGDVRVA